MDLESRNLHFLRFCEYEAGTRGADNFIEAVQGGADFGVGIQVVLAIMPSMRSSLRGEMPIWKYTVFSSFKHSPDAAQSSLSFQGYGR